MTEENGFISAEDILRLDEDQTEEIILPSGKGKVLVKGLPRAEVLTGRKLKSLGEIDSIELECIWIAAAMVVPKLTEKQVAKWQKSPNSNADLMLIQKVVTRLSGMDEGTPKSAVQNDGRAS